MVERKLVADNWAIRKLVDMKIGRYENWSTRNMVENFVIKEQKFLFKQKLKLAGVQAKLPLIILIH